MNDLDRLKSLLLASERERLEKLQARLDDPRVRSEELARLLPAMIRKASQRSRELGEVLQEPVQTGLRMAILKDTRTFAEVLFPVMGPAIRRAIVETLREMLQSVNQVLDQSLSLRGIGWRLEALRSGVPFHEVVLCHTLLFRVEQVFLIHRSSGLLIQHVAAANIIAQDPDAVSAMLTAIQDFAQDSFGDVASEKQLSSVDLDEQTLWLIHGPYALLACVIRGIPPLDLKQRFTEVLERLHADFGPKLQAFNGNQGQLEATQEALAACLVSEQKPLQRRRISPILILLLLSLLAAVGWYFYANFQERQRWQELLGRLEATPGVVVLDVQSGDQGYRIKGLKDPLATLAPSLVEAAGFLEPAVGFEWHAYQSAVPELALARARVVLQPPPAVDLSLQDGVLKASGVADDSWSGQVSAIVRLIPGVEAFDASALRSWDDWLLEQARKRLQPPQGIQMEVVDHRLILRGRAPKRWLDTVQQRSADLSNLKRVDLTRTQAEEAQEWDRQLAALQGQNILFQRGRKSLRGQEEGLNSALGSMQALVALAPVLERSVRFQVAGHTDGTGSRELNRLLAVQRARVVIDWLLERGMADDLLVSSVNPGSDPDNATEQSLREKRRVDFRLLENPGQSTAGATDAGS